MVLAYAGVVQTEGDGRPVQEGEFSSFRTQPFSQSRTFLCVASCVGDVLGVCTFVILYRELLHLHRLHNKAWEETQYHALLG